MTKASSDFFGWLQWNNKSGGNHQTITTFYVEPEHNLIADENLLRITANDENVDESAESFD